ncbi:MAG: TPM domain-containing protein [Enterocloster sp.]
MKRIQKKITAVLAALLLAILFCIPAAAAGGDEEGFADEYYRLMDMADLLSDTEEQKLLNVLDEVSERQKLEVVIITTDTLEGSDIVSFADDLYDYCQYGYGTNRDGVLLLISKENRDWYISTCGYGITAFTDAGIQYIGGQMKSDLSAGNYAAAFRTYIEKCDEFITQARTGKPFDKSSLPRSPMSAIWVPISLIVGIAMAVITVGGMKAQLKTVRFQPEAKNYIRDGSLNITQSRDLFLYRTVTRTEKSRDEDSGSSTHTTSSGTTHGGGGGKF